MDTGRAKRWKLWVGVALVAASWTIGGGLVSSNDGSHLALARALVLRGSTRIDPDRDLCLRVDVARRRGHAYSDRPPGTAWLAAPAVWLGARLDPTLARWSGTSGRIAVRPARRNYARTYAARLRDGPALIGLQGTALLVGWHVRLMGLLGLGLLLHLLAIAKIAPWRRAAVVLAMAVGSLWGPYSTVLFSHVTAGTMLLALWILVVRDQRRAGAPALRRWSAVATPLLGGACGALAIASDYLLLLAVVPLVALHAPARRWPLWFVGAAPVVALVAVYHDAAFGSPWAVGYDFQQNFSFARQRGATFDGPLTAGLWTLWGAGRRAGLLAQSPLWLLGLLGLLWLRRWRIALALSPWVVALAMHHTPWGGGTQDHRYLVPVLPALALGVALGWQRLDVLFPAFSRLWAGGFAGLALWSGWRVWHHFLSWRG